MKQAVVKLSALMVLLITTAIATPTHWRTLSPGVEYTKLSMLSGFHTGHLHAFRINLEQNKLELAIAEDQRNKIATVLDLVVTSKGIVGINGGFFSQELKPLGLRISNGVLRNPIKATPWWGVFYIKNNQPYIVSQKDYRTSKNIQFAVQSGPRLIVNNKIPLSLKPGVDSRTAVGITQRSTVILVVTDRLSLSTTQLAKVMKAPQMEGGLGCHEALNLDGGTSSQLYVKTPDFSLSVPSFSAVTDAILVIPKTTDTKKNAVSGSDHSNN